MVISVRLTCRNSLTHFASNCLIQPGGNGRLSPTSLLPPGPGCPAPFCEDEEPPTPAPAEEEEEFTLPEDVAALVDGCGCPVAVS